MTTISLINPDIFQVNMKRLMKKNSMSVERLSLNTGICTSTIAAYKSGKVRPTSPMIQAMAKALHCEVGEFFKEENDVS